MMKRLWRPDNWYTEYPDACMSCPNVSEDEWGKLCDLPCGEYTARSNFEAGADALLKELFRLAKESPTGTFTIDSEIITVYKVE